jgi:endo-1,3(4)-beta-glucanase
VKRFCYCRSKTMERPEPHRYYNKREYFQLDVENNPAEDKGAGVACVDIDDENSLVLQKYSAIKKHLLIMLLASVAMSTVLLMMGVMLSVPTEGGALSKMITFKQVVHPLPVSAMWGTVSKPYPTGAFWTNLVVNNGDNPVSLGAYDVKTVPAGVQVSYSATRRSVSQSAITDPFDVDFQIAAAEAYATRSVLKYDNLSVTMQYQNPGSTGKYLAYLVKGSVFVTVEFQGSTPVISAPNMHITGFAQQFPQVSNGASQGQQYLVTLGNYQQWIVYCSTTVTLNWNNGDSITAAGPMNGVIRIAILPLQNVQGCMSALQPYLSAYPTGGTVALSYPSPQQVNINYQFTVAGKGSILMFAYPHHVTSMISPDLSAALQLRQAVSPVFGMKGLLQVVAGNSWKMQLALAQVGWNYNLVDPLSNSQLDEIANNLMADVMTELPNAADVYSFAKQMGRMAQLALIADDLGIAQPRQQALSTLELAILPWLQGTAADSFVYDKTYGGVVTAEGVADSKADYGSGWYNDHHFHFGYLIFAAAVITRFDAPFYTANGPLFDSLVRDVCNPDPTDPDFPVARHKDMFDGHSWATGLFPQANGKSQESSSEVPPCSESSISS